MLVVSVGLNWSCAGGSITQDATPPLITTQPASQSVIVGQSATFSVVATGTSPLSYQWQQNGVVITGATAPIYTTPPTAATDTGLQFRVVVSNSAGEAASNLPKFAVDFAH